MATQTWEFDAPTGAYKDHKISSKVFKAAIAQTKVMQFVPDVEGGFGENMGESVALIRAANIASPTSAVLEETLEIPEDPFSISTSSITLQEIGRKVVWTRRASQRAPFDMPEVVVDKLRDQLSLELDRLAIAAFTGAQIKAIPDGEASLTFDTDGTASTAATVNLNYFHVEQLRDYLFSTIHSPTFEGDEFFGLVSTKGLRGLKQDPKFEVWNRYTTPENKANGEVGKIEGIRFIEINNTNVLSATLGTGSVLGEGVFFGRDAVRMAAAVPPEIFREIPTDGGRRNVAGWYGDIGFGEVFPTSNDGEARILHLTSS